ncbi:MAG: hypothetical protein N0C90_17340, partial [Candidatus Thiodiazotropha endolucinida]|nr:hypothetical protein [Candidatus Thiodiazotropha taylori]MCW4263122.1 hypothetical protein [Candidatus Thiodiazotropha endolucinida]
YRLHGHDRHAERPNGDQTVQTGNHAHSNPAQTVIDLTIDENQINNPLVNPLPPNPPQATDQCSPVMEPQSCNINASTLETDSITPILNPYNNISNGLVEPVISESLQEPNGLKAQNTQSVLPENTPGTNPLDNDLNKPPDNDKLSQVRTNQHFLSIPHVQRKPPDMINCELPALITGRQSV